MRLKKDNNDFPFTEKSLDLYIRKVIVKEINDLKSQVIDDVSQNHHRNLKKPQSFLNRVNDLLKFWHDYGMKAIEDLKSANLVANSKVNMSYGFVKQFLFGKFDFKSVLLYVDGMFRHIDEAKKKYTQQDLQDFYLYTIKNAYGTDYNDIDTLLSACDVDTKIQIPDEEDTFNPNIIQDYELFKESDYTDLYKSIEGVIDFIGNDRLKVLFQLKKQVKESLLISHIIKSIFDYIIYSITIYIVRIYVVSNFVLQHAKMQTESSFNESVITAKDTIDDFLKKMVIFKLDIENAYWYNDSIFASTDDLVARSLDKSNFFDLFKTFMELHSISYSDEKPDLSKFKAGYSKIFKDSQLFNFIVNTNFNEFQFSKPNVDELYLKLKYLLYTPNIGLQHIGHPVHNHRAVFIDTLIKTACVDKDNLSILKKSVIFIYHFSKFMFEYYLPSASAWINNLPLQCIQILPSEVTTYKKLYSEMNEFITQFYNELSLIVFKILQYIENKMYYYENESKRTGKIKDNTGEPEEHYLRPIGVFDQIYVDNQDTFNESDESLTRALLYPYYENISLYNNYIKSLPIFENSEYFNEGIDLGDLNGLNGSNVNWKQMYQKAKEVLTSLIQKAIAACQNFITDARLIPAFNWVKNNYSKINTNGVKLPTVADYREKILVDDLAKLLEELIAQNNYYEYLKSHIDTNIFPKEVYNRLILENDNDINKMKTIYPSYIFYNIPEDKLKNLFSQNNAKEIDKAIDDIKLKRNVEGPELDNIVKICKTNFREEFAKGVQKTLKELQTTLNNALNQSKESSQSGNDDQQTEQDNKEIKAAEAEKQPEGGGIKQQEEQKSDDNSPQPTSKPSDNQKLINNIIKGMIVPTINSFKPMMLSYYETLKRVYDQYKRLQQNQNNK